MQYYFKYDNVIIFNDLLYIEDHPHWNDTTIWKPIPGYSLYLINACGNVIRARDSYLMRVHYDVDADISAGTGTVTLMRDGDHKKEKVYIRDIIVPSASAVDILDDLIQSIQPVDLAQNPVDPVDPVDPPDQSYAQYLNNYPIILTDSDGEFIRWYPSIYNMLQRTHGTEGMDPHVIYRACNSPIWQKCYGKMFRWDPLLYVKYAITSGNHVS